MNKHPFLLLIGLLWLETGFSQEPSIYKKIDARISQLQNQEIQLKTTAQEFPDNYDVRYYGIELEILPASKSIAGTATIRASILKDDANSLVFNLHDNMIVNSVSGNAISSSHQDHLLTLQLDRVYHTGEEIVVTITYAGQPKKGTSYEPFHFEKANNTWYISSDNEPYEARLWLPCNDHPGDKADSTDMMITVPGDLYVVSNGLLKEVVDHPDGTKTFHWQEQYPIATYLMSLAISNYVFFDDRYVTATGDSMSLQFYAYPANLTKAKKEFAITADAIRYFVPIFGEYPFLKEKYGMVEYSGYWGGMENQTITSIGSTAIRGDGSAEFLIAHELAHQWWGDWVTPTHFDHIWLNEGFATYAEVLYAGAKYGQDFADYYMNLIMESALPSQGPIFRYGSDEIITWIVYGKGAAVLHMLRQLIGDMAFFDALRAYGQTHAFGNASTEDFQSFCEASSGTDLDWFFHQWIYEPGHPRYKYAWTSVKKNEMEYELIGYIDQIQSEGPVFRMPLDIFITTSDGATIKETMLVDDASETFRFTVQGQPTQLILDKDNRVLKEVVLATPEPKIIFRGHTFDDSRGNGNGYWDRGETIDVVLEILNSGLDEENVTVTLSTTDPDVSLQNSTAYYPSITHGASVSNIEQPFVLTLNDAAESHFVVMLVNITDGNQFVLVDSFHIGAGVPHILLVDDDEGKTYEDFISPILREELIYIAQWDRQVLGIPADTLFFFDTILWITGDDRQTTLDPDEQRYLSSFLDRGGKLLISGQNIGYDLAADGSPEDSLFYATYLKANYVTDELTFTLISGFTNDPVTNGIYLSFIGNYGGAGNQHSPDVIEPMDSATPILQYLPGHECAGLRYVDDFSGSRVIYVPFGIEGLAGPYSFSASRFLRNCFAWLSGETTVDKSNPSQVIIDFALEQNYPNPFNARTVIEYRIPNKMRVTIQLYDVLGREVLSLIDSEQMAGMHRVQWDGTDQSGQQTGSGLYFYRIKAGNQEAVRKMLLLR